ncbi:hypothetical protein BU26DRAFT_246549 [Trematosphaeria pertusa]|uniref:Uncharacterized protein n=1 Tax=Trematosphaeria pertusa TaxID=390896 RepID=A0A6A6IMT9_9PLEO|nr:uncharacterized protein BU26DRAFT_246549 [Trematosphaeria pertusa]KAF2251885.1 hypothetical protein BU26DRAFT_246549 [Trematosphaeria pertusa]
MVKGKTTITLTSRRRPSPRTSCATRLPSIQSISSQWRSQATGIAYTCGRSVFTDSVRSFLAAAKVPGASIRSESFSIEPQSADISDITPKEAVVRFAKLGKGRAAGTWPGFARRCRRIRC